MHALALNTVNWVALNGLMFFKGCPRDGGSTVNLFSFTVVPISSNQLGNARVALYGCGSESNGVSNFVALTTKLASFGCLVAKCIQRLYSNSGAKHTTTMSYQSDQLRRLWK